MEGEMISGAPRVVIYRCDQCGKVRKFFFVPQEADEFYRAEFTVCVDIAVQQVRFQYTTPPLRDGGTHPQTGDPRQRAVRAQAMYPHDIYAVAQGTVVRYPVIQGTVTDAATQF